MKRIPAKFINCVAVESSIDEVLDHGRRFENRSQREQSIPGVLKE